jgi:hypothetical protein
MERVQGLTDWMAMHHVALGRVAILGPGNPGEQLAFQAAGCKESIAIDLSDQACRLIRAEGLKCIQGDINDLAEYLEPAWNFYACHMLEHSRDAAHVTQTMKELADQWIFINIPIEEQGTKNPAHYSPFKSQTELLDMMRPWLPVHSLRKPKNFWALFMRQQKA